MNKMRILPLTTLIALVFGASLATHASQVQASAPFECQPGFYQVISGQLNILNPLTGQYTPIGAQQGSYNAIGFNPVDNYIYGWGTGGNLNGQVIRVASDGSVTTLGNAGQTGTTFVSADFDSAGFLWMRKNSTTLVKVDVRGATATSENITFTGAAITGVDMGWINDTLYSVADNTLIRINLNDNTVTHATITDLNSPVGKEFPTTGNYGAVFASRTDGLYASRNENGSIYTITDYETANPRATWLVDAAQTSNNDGAACKLAPSPFDTPTSEPDTYTTPNNSTLNVTPDDGVLSNDGASEPTVVSNTDPTSGSLVFNSDGSFTYTPEDSYVGTVTFDYTGQDQWGRSMPPATVSIEVTVPTTTTTTKPKKESVLPNTGSNIGSHMLVPALLVMAGSVLLGRIRTRNS